MFKFLKEKLLGWRQKTAEEVKGLKPEDVVGERGRKVREGKLEDVLADLEIALLEADVAQPVVEAIVASMKEELIGKRITREVSFDEGVEIALKHAIEKVLAAERIDFLEFVKRTEKPVVVMFVGVNGTGKTTAIAKVTNLLQKNGYGVVIAAATVISIATSLPIPTMTRSASFREPKRKLFAPIGNRTSRPAPAAADCRSDSCARITSSCAISRVSACRASASICP